MTPNDSTLEDQTPTTALLGLALPLLAGALLRLYNLRSQVLVDDEIHALRVALDLPLHEILTTWLATDFCQPLTAVYRISIEAGLPLSEALLRLPVMVIGTGGVALLPALLRNVVAFRTRVLFAWLLALSPNLVLYSRMVRSYGIVTVLLPAAAFLYWRWLEGGRAWFGTLSGVLGAVCVYLHLGSGPAVVAFFLYQLASTVLSKKMPALRSIVPVATFTLTSLLFLAPSWRSLVRLVESKHVEQMIPGDIVLPVLQLQMGATSVPVAIVLLILTMAGFGRLVIDADMFGGRFGRFLATVVLFHILGLLVLSPWGLTSPQIFNRYLLFVSPFLLIAQASLLARIRSSILVSLAVAAIFVAGPLARSHFWASSFMHSHDRMSFFAPTPRALRDTTLLDGYQESLLGSGPIVEFPFETMTLVSRAIIVAQSEHGKRVLVSTLDRRLMDPRLALRNAVPPTREALLASDATALVLHRNPEAGERQIMETRWVRHFPMPTKHWEALRSAARRKEAELVAAWGPPDQSGRFTATWNLARVRAQMRGSADP